MRHLFLILTVCFSMQACSQSDSSKTSDDDTVLGGSVETPFIHKAAQEHHLGIRSYADKIQDSQEVYDDLGHIDSLLKYVFGKFFREALHQYETLPYWQDASEFTGVPFSIELDKHGLQLCDKMKRQHTGTELLDYMDKEKCRTAYNEVLISSYIVLQDEEDTPLDGIDWERVGRVDAEEAASGGGLDGAVRASVVEIVTQIVDKI
jgi:hypothetical protein